MRCWWIRGRVWLLCSMFGGVAALAGCDASVRSDVLSGIGTAATSLATTLVEAFFDGLVDEESGEASVMHVSAQPALQTLC